NDLKSSHGEYRPHTSTEPAAAGEHGTVILVEQMTRKSRIDVSGLAASLARLFNYVDETFTLTVVKAENPESAIAVTRELRYTTIAVEATWEVPEDLEGVDPPPDASVRGTIHASEKPLPQELRGVTLYVHGRLANEPEYFGVPES